MVQTSPTLLSSFASKYGLGSSFARSAGNSEPVPEDEEEVVQSVVPDVSLVLGDDSEAGAGSLWITTRRVIWGAAEAPAGGAEAGPSLVLRYQQIVMHAISREPSSFARPCIYLQLDDGSEDMDEGGSDAGDEGQQDLAPELRLVPQDGDKVQDIFKALCDCAALNPDNEEEVEGEGDFFFDEDEVLRGLDDEERAALLARQAGGMELEEGREELGELVGEDPGRFEDDEDEEEEEEQAEEEGDRPAAAPGTRPQGNGHLHG